LCTRFQRFHSSGQTHLIFRHFFRFGSVFLLIKTVSRGIPLATALQNGWRGVPKPFVPAAASWTAMASGIPRDTAFSGFATNTICLSPVTAFSSNALIRLSRAIRFNQENWKNRKEKCPPRSFSAKKQ
jgi:hypothetical protein